MNIIIRKTKKSEYYQTEYLTREAFWNLYQPGCCEHFILHNLRKSDSYISELDLVAIYNNDIIAHVISTKAKITNALNSEKEVLCLGPIAVKAEYRSKGVGTALINESIRNAGKVGFPAIILFGNPDYYKRFGFVNAEKFSITTKDYQNFDAFMALELFDNSLKNINGCFFESEAFSIKDSEMEFEKLFPYKEKLITETQFKH